MIRAALLTLSLLAQPAPEKVSVKGVQSVPAYSLAKLKATNATAPLNWSVYQLTPVGSYTAGEDFVFTAPPGSYLVVLSAANGTSTWQIQFGAGNGPSPSPIQPPSPQPGPIPTPPQPQPDPDSGFVYPETTGFSAAVSKAARSSTAPLEQAIALQSLYRFTAEKIRLDGLRKQPLLKSLSDATGVVKSTEDELIKTTGLRSLKQAFPEVSKVAAAEFGRQTKGTDNELTPQNRAAYVDFLNQLASGFDQARPQ